MKMQQVTSSNLDEVGYDETTECLRVKFHTGVTYEYLRVPKDIHLAIVTSNSPGSVFTALVKRREYDFKKVEG